jgi:hypothetical protein
LRPRGTGKTTIQPTETLHVAEDGTINSNAPTEIRFKEEGVGFKPVCPFFELHGEWVTPDGATQHGPITPQILSMFGLEAKDLIWKIEVANLKAHNFTLAFEDRITANVELTGDKTEKQELRGKSQPDPNKPPEAQQPLIPANIHLPLGFIQLTKPTDQFPEFRLRFTPARGFVYGSQNFSDRTITVRTGPGTTIEVPASDIYHIPENRRILNPNALWPQFVPTGGDPRTNPGGLYTTDWTQGKSEFM